MDEVVAIRPVDSGLVCEFGTFTNSQCDPRRRIEGPVLVEPKYFDQVLREKLVPNPYGGVFGAEMRDGRRIVTFGYGAGHWEWELFDGELWGARMLVGRPLQ